MTSGSATSSTTSASAGASASSTAASSSGATSVGALGGAAARGHGGGRRLQLEAATAAAHHHHAEAEDHPDHEQDQQDHEFHGVDQPRPKPYRPEAASPRLWQKSVTGERIPCLKRLGGTAATRQGAPTTVLPSVSFRAAHTGKTDSSTTKLATALTIGSRFVRLKFLRIQWGSSRCRRPR